MVASKAPFGLRRLFFEVYMLHDALPGLFHLRVWTYHFKVINVNRQKEIPLFVLK